MKKSVLFVSAALMMCYFTSCGGGKKTDEAAADATAEAKTEQLCLNTNYWIYRQSTCLNSRKMPMVGLLCLMVKH